MCLNFLHLVDSLPFSFKDLAAYSVFCIKNASPHSFTITSKRNDRDEVRTRLVIFTLSYFILFCSILALVYVSPTISPSFVPSFHLPSCSQNKANSLFRSPPNPLTSHSYKDKVKDYNFGSLIRTDARDEYGEKNTIFGISLVPLFQYIYVGVLTLFFFLLVTRIQVRIYIPSLSSILDRN